MSFIKTLNLQQIGARDWEKSNVGVPTISKYPSFLQKILKSSSPKQCASFLKNINVEELFQKCNVDDVVNIIKKAKPFWKEFELYFYVLSENTQLLKEDCIELKEVIDFSNVYTQDWITADDVNEHLDDIDIVSAILYFEKSESKKHLNDFIYENPSIVHETIQGDFNGIQVSTTILAKYNADLDFCPEQRRIREAKIEESIVQELELFELDKYVDFTIDEACAVMNLYGTNNYYALMKYANHIR